MAISTNPKPTIYRNLYEKTVQGMVYVELTKSGGISSLMQDKRYVLAPSKISTFVISAF